jgi:glycine cleavage system H protein
LTDSDIPYDLLYTREHYWLRVEGKAATFGLTDHAQNELGDVVFVELPDTGEDVEAAEKIGTIESVKTTTEIYVPVSGEIVEVNEKLEKSPDLVNHDPYGDGWIARLRMSDLSETEELLSAEDYGHVVEEGE